MGGKVLVELEVYSTFYLDTTGDGKTFGHVSRTGKNAIVLRENKKPSSERKRPPSIILQHYPTHVAFQTFPTPLPISLSLFCSRPHLAPW